MNFKHFAENRYVSQAGPLIKLSIRIGLLLVLYLVLEWWLMHVSQLPQDSYHHPFIFVEIGKNFGALQLLFLAAIISILLWRRLLWQSWSAFEYSKHLRRLIVLVAFIAGWAFSTYDYNLYFNQGHYFDRALLLVLVVLIYWRPVFIVPFVAQLVSVIWQFNYPIGGYSVAEQFLFVRILILFFAAFLLKGLTGRQKTVDFVFIGLVLIASAYWRCGLGKIQLNWITHGHIYQLMFATYANGWLSFLEPATITALAKKIAWFDWPMRIFTLLVECGALLFLWRRFSLLAFLGGWIAFHFGIFVLTGICFWRWVVLEAAVFFFFLWHKRIERSEIPIFTREHFAFSVILIGSSIFWTKSVNLSWYDTRIGYTYRFEAVGESGKRYILPPRFFNPYDYQFTLGAFSYLAQEPRLRITWGVTHNRAIANALLQSNSPEQIYALESELGNIHFDSRKVGLFEDFLRQFIGNLNVRRSKRTWLSALQPPPLLWTFGKGNVFRGQEQITRVIVYQVTSLYDGKQYLEIRKEVVREIDIPLLPIPLG